MLDARLLGEPDFRSGAGEPLAVHGLQRELLVYLLVHLDASLPRDQVACALWPEVREERSRARLSTALWRLRGALTGAASIDKADPGHLRLPAGDVTLDVAAFERVAVPLCDPRHGPLLRGEADVLAEALGLYGGDLAAGVDAAWLMDERERLRMLRLRTLTRLLDHAAAAGQTEQAISWGNDILQDDPLREGVHRTLMRCYARAGDRTAALRQYRTCRRLLRDELGVEPMPETVACAEEIAAGGGAEVNGADRSTDALLGRLERMRDQIAALGEAVDQAITELHVTSAAD